MKKIQHIVLSYKEGSLGIEAINEEKSYKTFSVMTHMYRMSFWSIFESYICIHPMSGAPGRKLYLYKNNKSKLGETEGSDYILYYSKEIECEHEENVGPSAADAEDEIRKIYGSDQLSQFKSDYVGKSSWISDYIGVAEEEIYANITAYYFYAWILLLRTERGQIEQDVSPKIKMQSNTVEYTIKQRIRLLNLERYFLLEDRTNNKSLKEACIKLSKKYRLRERYERANARHLSFERHNTNTTQELQSQRTAAVGNILYILTSLAIPIGVMQVLFGINLTGSVYAEPYSVINNRTTYMVVLVGMAVVIITLVSAHAYDKLKKIFRRKMNKRRGA